MMHDSDNLVLDDLRTAARALARAIAGIYERRGELATADFTSARRPAGGPPAPDRGASRSGGGVGT